MKSDAVDAVPSQDGQDRPFLRAIRSLAADHLLVVRQLPAVAWVLFSTRSPPRPALQSRMNPDILPGSAERPRTSSRPP